MKLVRNIFFVLITLFSAQFVQAQNKLAHINTQELLLAMPEREGAEKKIQDFAKSLESQLQTLGTEYQNKLANYQQKAETMTNTERETAVNELTDLEQRIQQFRISADEKIQKQEAELLQPMIEKARKAIEEVSKAGGYTYVFDSSVGVLLYQTGEDLMPKVKAKLGL